MPVDFDEFMMFGGVLILVMEILGFKDDVQADVPIANIHFTIVRVNQFPSGKEDHAGMATEVLVAVLNEFCSRGTEPSFNIK